MYLRTQRKSNIVTKHYEKQRCCREKFINKYVGDGYIIDGFVVDKGHPNGIEVHSITENAIIIIHNYRTGKLVTKLLARPQQIKRYYESTGRKHPAEYEHILELAKEHNILGYNDM
jgi:hypothetical protein